MSLLNTWVRMTAVCWLVSIPATVMLSLLSVDKELRYIVLMVLFTLILVVAGRLLACPTKPLSTAIPVSILTVTVFVVAVENLPGATADFLWVIENLMATFMIVLLVVRGGLDLHPFKPWAFPELLAAITAVAFGAASIWSASDVSRTIVEALAPATFAATGVAGVFALVFELVAPADSLTSESS